MAKPDFKSGLSNVRQSVGGGGLNSVIPTRQMEQVIKQESKEEAVRDLANTVVMLPIEYIAVNPDQPRKDFDEAAMNELAESIKVHDVIQPITVRRLDAKKFQIISGERRYRASMLAGKKEIPAYVRLVDDQQMLEMALIENIQREDLNPMEVAMTYSRLKEEFRLTDEKLAERVGKERSTVTNYLRLLDLDNEVKIALKNQQITTGHAKALAGIKNNRAVQDVVLTQIKQEGLSVRAAEGLVRAFLEGKNDFDWRIWLMNRMEEGESALTVIRLSELLQKSDADLRKMILDKVSQDTKPSVKEIEALIANYGIGGGPSDAAPKMPKPASSRPRELSADLIDIERRLKAFFSVGGKHLSLKREPNGKGQIVIKFDNDEQLNQLLDRIEKED